MDVEVSDFFSYGSGANSPACLASSRGSEVQSVVFISLISAGNWSFHDLPERTVHDFDLVMELHGFDLVMERRDWLERSIHDSDLVTGRMSAG